MMPENMHSTACDLETAGLDTKALLYVPCVSFQSYLSRHYIFWLPLVGLQGRRLILWRLVKTYQSHEAERPLGTRKHNMCLFHSFSLGHIGHIVLKHCAG